MASLKDMAIELATVNLVADLVAEHKDNLRAQMAQAFLDAGSDSVKAQIGDERIGKVSLVEPKAKPFVANESEFTEWVQAEHLTEIVCVVRESFKKHVLDNVEILEDGTAVLKTTGEIVPGISGRKGSPYVSTRFETDGREKLGRALQNGEISFALPTIKQQLEGNNE